MQLMSWMVARLGSRFCLTFEPHRRRVMHSALGRFLDQPLDLMVGLVEPDGAERVMPFTERGELLYNLEQFERLNSITFRGFSEAYRLQFELNVHSVFYPQDEPLCLLPVFYLEMRLNPVDRIRWVQSTKEQPESCRLFIRVQRPDTAIEAIADDDCPHIDLRYDNPLMMQGGGDVFDPEAHAGSVAVRERIESLNADCTATEDGQGLSLDLPVTEVGSGTKWRLVWGAYVEQPVLKVKPTSASDDHEPVDGSFRYRRLWKNLDEVMADAVRTRDDHLAHSRRLEKLFDTTTLSWTERHLLNQSFQSFLSNTWWCELADGREWFSVWEGSCFYHSTLDVEYNQSPWYLMMWPRLLVLLLDEWPEYEIRHEESGGSYLSHDMGQGRMLTGQAYFHDMPAEENCNYLLILQAYCHWKGDLSPARRHADLIERLANYLIWTDRDDSGFPSEGMANTLDDAGPAQQYARKQTYLAVKRAAGLQAAADLLGYLHRDDPARRCAVVVEQDVPKIETAAWLNDHYAVCVDPSATGLADIWTGEPLPYEQVPGWDAYSLYTGNGLLLPMIIGQPLLLDSGQLEEDLVNATRETLGPYGSGHTSAERENVWISQNIWRDLLLRYVGGRHPDHTGHYWDLQAMSNTGRQSFGFIDTYVGNMLCFYPRGVASFGYLLSHPRLVIDRLGAGGQRIVIEPDRDVPQRWPLLALADWRAGKIPVCVVSADGHVFIEGESDPVVIRGQTPTETELIG